MRTGKDAAGQASATVNVGRRRAVVHVHQAQGRDDVHADRSGTQLSWASASPSTAKVSITALPGKPKITSAKSGSKKDKAVSVSLKLVEAEVRRTRQGLRDHRHPDQHGLGQDVHPVVLGPRREDHGLKKNKRYVLRVRAINDSGKGSTYKWKHSVKAR